MIAMETKAKLESALKEAMKAGDELRRRTIRMALAAIKQAEIDRRAPQDEAAVISLLQKEIKMRKEALEEARLASRADLAAAAEAEIAVVNEFLPRGLAEEELAALAAAAIADAGATSLRRVHRRVAWSATSAQRRRQSLGDRPVCFLKARLKAASES